MKEYNSNWNQSFSDRYAGPYTVLAKNPFISLLFLTVYHDRPINLHSFLERWSFAVSQGLRSAAGDSLRFC